MVFKTDDVGQEGGGGPKKLVSRRTSFMDNP